MGSNETPAVHGRRPSFFTQQQLPFEIPADADRKSLEQELDEMRADRKAELKLTIESFDKRQHYFQEQIDAAERDASQAHGKPTTGSGHRRRKSLLEDDFHLKMLR